MLPDQPGRARKGRTISVIERHLVFRPILHIAFGKENTISQTLKNHFPADGAVLYRKALRKWGRVMLPPPIFD